jgi:tetratricopeptide (TPR) repeat protein
MARVVYHNEIDILTLVGLATQVLDRHRRDDPTELSGSEALAVARWHHEAERLEQAEAAYQAALVSTNPNVRMDALRRYTAHLKRQGRRKEAVGGWETMHDLAPDDPTSCIELAKYYEWHAQDLKQALSWAQEALVCLTHWADGWRRDQAWESIEHRMARLKRKMGVRKQTS